MPLNSIAPTTTEREREDLRALIEQRTQEFEAQNGKIKTAPIIQRDSVYREWNQSANEARKIQPPAQAKPAIRPAKAPKLKPRPKPALSPERSKTSKPISKPVPRPELRHKPKPKIAPAADRSECNCKQQLVEINAELDELELNIMRFELIAKN